MGSLESLVLLWGGDLGVTETMILKEEVDFEEFPLEEEVFLFAIEPRL